MAIQRIQDYAKEYNTNPNNTKYLDTLSTLIEVNFLIERIQNFLFIDPSEEFLFEDGEPLPQPGIHIGTSYLSVPDLEDAYLLGIVRALADTKQQIKENDEVRLRAPGTNIYLDE